MQTLQSSCTISIGNESIIVLQIKSIQRSGELCYINFSYSYVKTFGLPKDKPNLFKFRKTILYIT